MKKILLFSVLLAVVASSCKKNPGNPSEIYTVSPPTITFANHLPYFSIALGGVRPSSSAVATAYDSVYGGSYSVVLIDSMVNTDSAGLYQAIATTKNKYGFVTQAYYYVAVTNLPGGAPNIAGTYQTSATNDSFYNNISSLGNGFYVMNNFGGANLVGTPGADSTAVFAIIDNSTIAFAASGLYSTPAIPISGIWLAWGGNNGEVWLGSAYYGLTGTLSLGATDTISYNGLTYTK